MAKDTAISIPVNASCFEDELNTLNILTVSHPIPNLRLSCPGSEQAWSRAGLAQRANSLGCATLCLSWRACISVDLFRSRLSSKKSPSFLQILHTQLTMQQCRSLILKTTYPWKKCLAGLKRFIILIHARNKNWDVWTDSTMWTYRHVDCKQIARLQEMYLQW